MIRKYNSSKVLCSNEKEREEERNSSWFEDTIINVPENLDLEIPRWLKAKKRAKERTGLGKEHAVSLKVEQQDLSSTPLSTHEIVSELEHHAAIDIKVIDVSHKVDHLSQIVICNGRYARHAYSIADSIRILAKNRYVAHGGGNSLMMPDTLAMEGRDSEDWLLLDLGHVMVHVFTPQGRKDIDLESLWMDAA